MSSSSWRKKSNGQTRHTCHCSSLPSTSSSSTTIFFARASSPTRLSVYSTHRNSSSVRFSIYDRPTSPSRSISIKKSNNTTNGTVVSSSLNKKTCMCSPTTHPGSFRCALHRRRNSVQTTSYQSTRSLNFRRSAMANSLVRICGVEGDLVKRALTALIRPSSHQQRRRVDFQPRPSRLSVMCKADDDDDDLF